MNILSHAENQCGFNEDSFLNTKIDNENQQNSLFNENSNDDVQIFRLNPLLNDSLNNLVKRFERTKIPKPPPTKGLSIRKKSKLSNSLPNLFLPSGFDDNKYCSNEKKVTWTNKLDLNLDRLKNAFRDTYTNWCEQKRSQSIPTLNRNINDEHCKKDSTNTILSNAPQLNALVNESITQTTQPQNSYVNIGGLQSSEESINEKLNRNIEITQVEGKQPYCSHVYLDGAIIEPISPASQTCSTVVTMKVVDTQKKEENTTLKVLPRKKGRPKKNQNPTIGNELVLESDVNKNLNDKSIKPALNKKQKKSTKLNQSASFDKDDVEIHNILNPDDLSNEKEDEIKRSMDNEAARKLKSTNADLNFIKVVSLKKQKNVEKTTEIFKDCGNYDVKDSQENSLLSKEDETSDKHAVSKQKKLFRQARQSFVKDAELDIKSVTKSYDIKDICGKDIGTKSTSPTKRHRTLSIETKISSRSTENEDLKGNNSTIIKSIDKKGKSDEKCDKLSLTKKQKKISKHIKSVENNVEGETSSVNESTKDIYQESIEAIMCKNFDTHTLKEYNIPVKKVATDNETDGVQLDITKDSPHEGVMESKQEKGSRKRKTTKSKVDKCKMDSLKNDSAESGDLILQGIDISPTEEMFLNVDSCKSLSNISKHVIDNEANVENPKESVKYGEKHVESDEIIEDNEENVKVVEESITQEREDVVEVLEVVKINVEEVFETSKDRLKIVEDVDKSVGEVKYAEETNQDTEVSLIEPQKVVNEDNDKNMEDPRELIDLDLADQSLEKVLPESHEKINKPKTSSRSRKQPLPISSKVVQPYLIEEITSEVQSTKIINLTQSQSKRVKLKHRFFDECDEIESKTVPAEEEELKVEAPLNEIIKGLESNDKAEIVDDLNKTDTQESIELSNDIEVLSKSLSDSVDTSMLPPRKRYKRLMYLDHSKSASPKDTSIIEDIKTIDLHDSLSQDDLDTKNVTSHRSRLKRKKQREPPLVVTEVAKDVFEFNNSISIEEVKDEETANQNKTSLSSSTETGPQIDVPSSLKRSKREAAARGFANMVAMSLNNNNNSQSHETSSDVARKASCSKVEEVSVDTPTKIFKRPRKSLVSNPSNIKTKSKSLKSYEYIDEAESVEEIEITKVTSKKQRISKEKSSDTLLKDNASSPEDTIVSSASSSQDVMKYRKIRTNLYIDQKPTHWNQEVEKCGCKRSDQKHLLDNRDKKSKYGVRKSCNIVWDCGDNCLNRLTYTECNPKTCQCGDLCNNQKIRKLEWSTSVKVTEIPSKGRGVITTKAIKEGTLITEYVGEVISEATFQERMINLYREDAHHYCLHLDGEMLIDAYRSGSLARFVNHSCQPNCEMQKWMVNGAYRMCLFVNEDITPDTELSYDYNFCSFNTKTTQICLCGASNCRGFIGGRPRPEQSESQKDRKKLFYVFGRMLSVREKLFVKRRSIFLIRARVLGRCKKLGIRRCKQTHGTKLPSAITEIKRRKAKKNQFLTQMSALNSIRSVRTRLLQNAESNESLTRTAQLGQVLRDLYNTLLEYKDPLNPLQQLVAPFINCLKPKKYPEFYATVGQDSVVSLGQVFSRLLDGKYATMLCFDQDMLQMLQHVELYAGRQSNIGKCAERIKPIYRDLKMNAIALYEALTDEIMDERDKSKLLSNNLTQITNAVKSLSSNLDVGDFTDGSQSSLQSKQTKKRKQGSANNLANSRGRIERGAEVIKCVCGFLIEAGHVMVQCDRCFVWQHSYCVNVARSAEVVDVTRMEPYFCHICLNIAQQSLVREIPRHFVITDETVDGGNTLFWTLLHSELSLLKIDDFVYVASEEENNTAEVKTKLRQGSPQPLELSRLTIMRIYSLWKDEGGRRWMEGGLFLRPYNKYIKSMSEAKSMKRSEGTNKRKSSLDIDLSSHKWHHQEVVYTELTKILPLEVCVGRCHVLNNHTFRLGTPRTCQSNTSNHNDIDRAYVCDWLINKSGEWSELDPSYLKINTKPYCFERHNDESNNELKFLRHYTAEELLHLDQGTLEESAVNKAARTRYSPNQEDKKISKVQSFEKLVRKLSEFAYERTRKLPLSPPSSQGSRSNHSSRGSSPLCDNAGSKSPSMPYKECYPHCSRKQVLPRKARVEVSSAAAQIITKTPNTVTSEYSDNSPKLMIVCDDDRCVKETNEKIPESLSSSEDKQSEVVENLDDRSNPCSEIKYGDLLTLLKETITVPAMTNKKKMKRKPLVKKNVLKPVSEINAADDNWVPCNNRVERVAVRRETRSRRSIVEEQEECVSNEVVENREEESQEWDEGEDKESKACFVKLERIKVSRTEKSKLKRASVAAGNKSAHLVESALSCSAAATVPCVNEENKPSTETIGELKKNDNDVNDHNQEKESCSATTSNSRSKRKKGVPKRIPFDFGYQQQTLLPLPPLNSDINPSVERCGEALVIFSNVVDLSAVKTVERSDDKVVNNTSAEPPDITAVAKVITKTKVNVAAANDFSSIENISSN